MIILDRDQINLMIGLIDVAIWTERNTEEPNDIRIGCLINVRGPFQDELDELGEILDPNATFTDEVGGFHDCGTGINPNGADCGECCFLTCKGCPHEHAKMEDE